MKKLTQIVPTTLAAILVVSVSQFGHVLAMQGPTDMTIDQHGVSTPDEQHCSDSRTNILSQNEDQQKIILKKAKKDHEPQPPYYLKFRDTTITTHTESLVSYNQPDCFSKIPLHRLYGVIRR